MFQKKVAGYHTVSSAQQRFRTLICVAVLVLGLSAISSAAMSAQSSANATKSFFNSIAGEWIGTCKQSTDGQQAEDKYFHAVIQPSGSNSYRCNFEYYRADPNTGAPLAIGGSSAVISLNSDGTVKSVINGKGTILVNKSPKNQSHQLNEVLTSNGGGGLQGQGTGTISVNGMPLGLGKNGKVRSSKSSWALNNGVLNIRQDFNIAFRALFITKSFSVSAQYIARKGQDVASLMPRETQASAKSPRGNRKS